MSNWWLRVTLLVLVFLTSPVTARAESVTELTNAAQILIDRGDWYFAELKLKDAVKEAEARGDARGLAFALSALANVYFSTGRLPEAKVRLNQAHRVYERTLGFTSPDSAIPLHNLALVQIELDELDAARSSFSQSRQILEQTAGPNDRLVLASLNREIQFLLDKWVARLQTPFVPSKVHLSHIEPLVAAARPIAELLTHDPEYTRFLLNDGRFSDYRASEKRDSLHRHEARAFEDRAEDALLKAFSLERDRLGGQLEGDTAAEILIALGDFYQAIGEKDQVERYHRLAAGVPKSRIMSISYATNRKPGWRGFTFTEQSSPTLHYGHVLMAARYDQLIRRSARQGQDGRLDASHSGLSESRRFVRGQFLTQAHQIPWVPNRVLLYIHGYSVTFDDALKQAAQIAFDLGYFTVAVFSWPANGTFGYFSARGNINAAAVELSKVIQRWRIQYGEVRLDLIAHSMGNAVLLKALDEIEKEYVTRLNSVIKCYAVCEPLSPNIGEIILAHPDVDSSAFEKAVATAKHLPNVNITVYVANNDRALWISRWLNWSTRAGAAPFSLKGADVIDISDLGAGLFSPNHNTYSTNPILFGDISRVLQRQRPPESRTSQLRRISSEKGDHWRYIGGNTH